MYICHNKKIKSVYHLNIYCNCYIFRSNLAAIFGLQSKLIDSQPNKQTPPKKNNTQYNLQQTVSSKTEVLIAKAVHVFKL